MKTAVIKSSPGEGLRVIFRRIKINLMDLSAEIHMAAEAEGRGTAVFSIDGNTVCAPLKENRAEAVIHLSRVHLWEGQLDPFLYCARVAIEEEGERTAFTEAHFGCRAAAFDGEEGFLLNGWPYPLKGLSLRGGLTDTGRVMEEARLLCANAIFLDGEVPPENTLACFDRAGILLCMPRVEAFIHHPCLIAVRQCDRVWFDRVMTDAASDTLPAGSRSPL